MTMNRSMIFSIATLSTYYLMILLFSTSYFIQEVTSGSMMDQFSAVRC